LDRIEDEKSFGISIKSQNSLSTKLSLIYEFKLRRIANSDETSILSSVFINYSSPSRALRINTALSLFNISSWKNRIYAYEQDVLYSFGINTFYNKGVRVSGMIQLAIFENVNLWIKYSMVNYSNVQNIASGNSQINGPIKSEAKVQLRIKL
jgi:hypothetical protein